MKIILIMFLGFFTLSVFAELSKLESKYLNQFANYTGNMGIGFVPEHTFDYNLRQAILKSKDEKVQRAFILYKITYRISDILHDLKNNRKMVGKNIYRKLTSKERKKLISAFNECMILLQRLEKNKDRSFYQEYKEKLAYIIKNKK